MTGQSYQQCGTFLKPIFSLNVALQQYAVVVAKGSNAASPEILSSDLMNSLDSWIFLANLDCIFVHQFNESPILWTPPAFYCLFPPLLVWLFASSAGTVDVVVIAAAIEELIPFLPGHVLLWGWWWQTNDNACRHNELHLAPRSNFFMSST